MKNRDRLVRIFMERDVSLDTIILLVNSMGSMSSIQKEERALKLINIVEKSESEEEMLEGAASL